MKQEKNKIKEIPGWTRKYAQNRMLTNLIFLLINFILFTGIFVPSYLYGLLNSKNENIVFKVICIIVSLASGTCLVYISIRNWGGLKLWKWIDQRIYHEGNVSIPKPEQMKFNKQMAKIIGPVFGACIIGTMILCGTYIPIEYMQPVSVIYCVPFMVFLYIWQRFKYGQLILIWPVLYAIHAILIIAGFPIVFTKNSELISLNMLIPTFGYGLLTFVIIYIYSRYALRKLKGLAHIEGDGSDGD